MEKKKIMHPEKIHEFFEGTSICEFMHRHRLCGCQEHEGEKKEEEKKSWRKSLKK
jgi:hypothetical protein